MRFSIILSVITSLFLSSGPARAQVAIDTALDFTVKDLEGVRHHLFEYLDAGNFVVIDFFTTNCGPCQTYASEISASFDYFGCNGGNVIFLGMNWGSDNQAVHVFDSTWGAYYPSVSGLQGGGNGVVDMYQVQSYPTVILIAPDRTILNDHIWPPSTDTINAIVLDAGGVAQACTVGVSQPDISPSAALQAIPSGQGSVRLKFNRTAEPGLLLQVYASDGRLVEDYPLTGSQPEITLSQLKSGVYIARLISTGNRVVSIKFSVN